MLIYGSLRVRTFNNAFLVVIFFEKHSHLLFVYNNVANLMKISFGHTVVRVFKFEFFGYGFKSLFKSIFFLN